MARNGQLLNVSQLPNISQLLSIGTLANTLLLVLEQPTSGKQPGRFLIVRLMSCDLRFMKMRSRNPAVAIIANTVTLKEQEDLAAGEARKASYATVAASPPP